jgi:two-component system, chemotaxis family, protein-glutamate methylesterase/glutaminase
MLRYRCRVGHAFMADAVLEAKNEEVDGLLWKLMRSHGERSALARRTAERERAENNHSFAGRLEARSQEYAWDAELVRRLRMDHNHAVDQQAGEDEAGARIAREQNKRR